MSQAAVVAQQRLGPHHHDMQPAEDHLHVQAAAAAAAVEGHIHHHQQADEELAARVAARLAAVVEAHGQAHHLSHNAAAMEAAAAAAAAELLEGELEFELSSSSCAMQSEESEGPSCYWLDGTEEDNAGDESDGDMEKPPVEEFPLCELDAADTRAIEVGGGRAFWDDPSIASSNACWWQRQERQQQQQSRPMKVHVIADITR